MQVLDEEKRQKILDAASALFATRPFHRVLLSDVATAAGVGKGTVYLYFTSKDELYFAVLQRGLEELVDQVGRRLEADASASPREHLEAIVRDFVEYAYGNPHLMELMRSLPMAPAQRQLWDEKRRELTELTESVIRRGIRDGEFCDPHPELTASFVPGLVRAALLDGMEGRNQQLVIEHILRFLFRSLDAVPQAAPAATHVPHALSVR